MAKHAQARITNRRAAGALLIAIQAILLAAFGGRILAAYVFEIDQRHAHFPDRAAAERASVVDDGWVPTYLPEDMTDIHVRYSVNQGQSIVRFHLAPEDMAAFERTITADLDFEPAAGIDPALVNRAAAWLPKEDAPPPDPNDTGYRFYDAKLSQVSGPVYLAVHAESGTVYHWVR